MRQKLRARSILLAILLVGLLSPVFAFAQSATTPSTDQQQFSENLAITTQQSLGVIIARVINVALGFLGIVAVVLILYAGFVWMTSRGEAERVKQAQKIMTRAVIGLAIVLAAFGIVQLVLRALGIENNSDIIPTPATSALVRGNGGALGSGIVESHFPSRGGTGIPRNTRIMVTFKDAVNPASIAISPTGKFFSATAGTGGEAVNRIPEVGLKLRTDVIEIVKTTDIKTTVRDDRTAPFRLGSETSGTLSDVLVSFTPDLRTYIFTPIERGTTDRRVLLGSSSQNTAYTVYLCGVAGSRGSCAAGGVKILPAEVRAKSGDVAKADLMNGTSALGVEAFGGIYKDYEWSFEISTLIDTTPPTISSIIPLPDKGRDSAAAVVGRPDKARNTIVQVNFSEAMLPNIMEGRVLTVGTNGQSSTTGALATSSYDRMLVSSGDSIVAGNWLSGNQYRTTEFTSAELCGKNSCGQDVYCLPRGARIGVKLTTAAHATGRDFTATSIVPDGLQDIAGNALDGNKNAKADGTTGYYDMACDATVGYNTCSASDAAKGDNVTWSFETSAIVNLTPPNIVSSVPGYNDGNISPSEPVRMSFSSAMSLVSLNSRNLDLSGVQVPDDKPWEGWWDIISDNVDTNGDKDPDNGVSTIRHNDFWVSTDLQSKVTREVKDVYQNCYFPAGTNASFDGAYCTEGARDANQNYCCNGKWQINKCF